MDETKQKLCFLINKTQQPLRQCDEYRISPFDFGTWIVQLFLCLKPIPVRHHWDRRC